LLLDSCRRTCQRCELVPRGDICRDAQDYLWALEANSTRGRSHRWKTDSPLQPVFNQSHSLTGRSSPKFTLSADRETIHELNSRVTPSPIVVVFDHGFEFRDCVSQLSGLSDDVRHLRHSAVEIVARSADSSKPIARQLARHGHFALPRWKIAEIVLPTCSRSTGVGVIPTAKNGCKARV
jgi:hypothetical protein